jgi:hypothetical protein
VQSTFRAQGNALLAAFFRKQLFTALTAEDYVAMTIDGRAATQDRTFVHVATLTDLRTSFAGVPVLLNVAAQTAQRHLKFRLVLVRFSHLLLAAAAKREQEQCGYQCR